MSYDNSPIVVVDTTIGPAVCPQWMADLLHNVWGDKIPVDETCPTPQDDD